jgi:16S rRNA (uracil1498-N3)-methyltransferase
MSHFYLPGNWQENIVLATDSLRHHLRVRRMQASETFQVFNGAGLVASAKIATPAAINK